MRNKVTLRKVRKADLTVFYEQQLDPEATRMAAFPSRGRDAFMAHWAKGTARLRLRSKSERFAASCLTASGNNP